jgi:hypothetical protein
MYDSKNELMQKLLVKMSDLIVEVDQIDNEMRKLLKQL